MIKRFPILLLMLLLTIGSIAQTGKTQLDSLFEAAYAAQDKAITLEYGQQLLAQSEEKYGKLDTNHLKTVHILCRYYSDVEWIKETESLVDGVLDLPLWKSELVPYNLEILLMRLVLDEYKGDLENFEKHIQESIKRHTDLNQLQTTTYASTLFYKGNLLMIKGQYQQAFPFLEKSLQLRKELLGSMHEDCGQAMNMLAICHKQLNNYDEANFYYESVIKLLEENDKRESIEFAAIMNNLATLNTLMGKYANAERMFKESLRLVEKLYGREHSAAATVLQGLGRVYRLNEQYDLAVESLKEQLTIFEHALGKQHPRYAGAVDVLAGCYKEMEEYEKAETLYQEAQDIFASVLGKDHLKYAITTSNLAILYLYLNDYEKAEALHLESLKIFQAHFDPSHYNVLIAYNNLADLYLAWEKHEEVKRFVYKSLQATCTDSLSANLNGLSLEQLVSQKQFIDFEHLQTALSYLAQSYQQEAEAASGGKQLQLAQKGHDCWIAHSLLADKARRALTDNADKYRISKNTHQQLDKSISNCLLLTQLTGEDKYLKQALSFADHNKSSLLADVLNNRAALNFGNVPDSLIQKKQNLSSAIAELEKKLVTQEVLADKGLREQLNAELALSYRTKDQLLDQLEKEYPEYYQLNYNKTTLDFDKIQQDLGDGQLLLEYFLQKDGGYVISLSKKSIKIYPVSLPDGKIDRLRKVLSDYAYINASTHEAVQEYLELGNWFYEQLLAAPLADHKGINHLIVITDGQLGHLPFESFLYESYAHSPAMSYNDLPYLVKKYQISYDYSLSLRNETSMVKQQGNQQVLAVAASYGNSADSSQVQRGTLRAPHLRNLRDVLQALPEAQKEVEQIVKSMNGIALYGEAANEGNFKSKAKEYSVIHLAMHGMVNPTYPILSSLVFTENWDSTENNFLQAYEIAQLELNAELVVLSACETGYGKFEQGEGVMSLARSFMYAGVPSLVVSLWQVNDASTSRIMQGFYANLAQGMNKAAALQQAKINFIEHAEGLAGHPAFWSPFILIGDESPVKLQKKSSAGWMSWAIGGGVGVLALLGLGLSRRKRAA